YPQPKRLLNFCAAHASKRPVPHLHWRIVRSAFINARTSGGCDLSMFKNLRTGTKLYILCGVFLFSVGVPAYGLVAEKQIAIGFARKELVGSRYLGAVRELHQSIMLVSTNGERSPAVLEALLAMLAHAEASSGAMGS